jgi:protein-tyrosine phosphatase
MVSVLFVCLGNICRSPMAHGVFRELVAERGLGGRVGFDSCGTSGYHRGEPPDRNQQQVARGHGFDISDLRSRPLVDSDFFEFDLIVCMDRSNEADVAERALPNSEAQIVRFMEFVPGEGPDVPDPYYGGIEGFEHVYDLITRGCPAVLDRALEIEASRG